MQLTHDSDSAAFPPSLNTEALTKSLLNTALSRRNDPALASMPGQPIVAYRVQAGETGCAIYRPSAGVILAGRKRSIIGERVYEYGAGDLLVTALDMPAVWQVLDASPEHPFIAVSLGISDELIRELLPSVPVRPGGDDAQAAYRCRTDPDLLDAYQRLLHLSDRPADIPVVAPMIVREIHWRLLCGPWGECLRRLFTADTLTNRITKAVAWLQENFREPLEVDRLASYVHMAPSTFYRHFKVVTSLSPLQYQKQLRLNEARRLMIATGADAATAAYGVGYVSATQFSRDYKRHFGAPPRASVSGILRGTIRA